MNELLKKEMERFDDIRGECFCALHNHQLPSFHQTVDFIKERDTRLLAAIKEWAREKIDNCEYAKQSEGTCKHKFCSQCEVLYDLITYLEV